MKKAERKNSVLGAKSAFTLVEMLVVIAVIGLLAAISIPMISNVFGNAEEGKDKRNAQILASMASAAPRRRECTTTTSPRRTCFSRLPMVASTAKPARGHSQAARGASGWASSRAGTLMTTRIGTAKVKKYISGTPHDVL